MKKRLCLALLALLLALSLCTPAMAAVEYGVIYDETEALSSQALTTQGEETLPQLSERFGIDLRVDVITQMSLDSIEETAAGIYDRYGYGYGDDEEGATLTLLLEPTEDGAYAMPEGGWCVYANLSEARGSSQALTEAVRDAVEPYMAARAWNGQDMAVSAAALAKAVDAMAQAVSDYLQEAPAPDGDAAMGAEAPAAMEQGSTPMEYVFDLCDLLPYEAWQELESRAKALTERHHCAIYFALVDDYTEYGDEDVYLTTAQLYHNSGLGYGEGRDGIIVLLSMAERDYAMFVYGTYAEYAFNEYGQEELEGYFLGDFGRDDWAGGISHYLDACHEFLAKAEAGEPVRESFLPTAVLMLGLSCVVAGVVCFWFWRRMKTVRPKSKADVYVAAGGLHLTAQRDQYERTVTTRTKIQKESSSGSGSTRSESGGGGSGRSGKF